MNNKLIITLAFVFSLFSPISKGYELRSTNLVNSSATPMCYSYPCERNYTVYSYTKVYLYAPTMQMITTRTTVEPAEFLDIFDPVLTGY